MGRHTQIDRERERKFSDFCSFSKWPRWGWLQVETSNLEFCPDLPAGGQGPQTLGPLSVGFQDALIGSSVRSRAAGIHTNACTGDSYAQQCCRKQFHLLCHDTRPSSAMTQDSFLFKEKEYSSSLLSSMTL